jgi:hypothetical protein
MLVSFTPLCHLMYYISPLNKIITAQLLDDYLECGFSYEFGVVDVIGFAML